MCFFCSFDPKHCLIVFVLFLKIGHLLKCSVLSRICSLLHVSYLKFVLIFVFDLELFPWIYGIEFFFLVVEEMYSCSILPCWVFITYLMCQCSWLAYTHVCGLYYSNADSCFYVVHNLWIGEFPFWGDFGCKFLD